MADITQEAIRRASETFRAAQAARAARKAGLIPGQTAHRLILSRHDDRVIHTVRCQLRAPGYGTYYVAYLSLPTGIDESNVADVTLLGREPTYFGPSFGHLRIPISLAVARHTLPSDLTYIGFDFLGSGKQPNKIDVNTDLERVAQLLFIPKPLEIPADASHKQD